MTTARKPETPPAADKTQPIVRVLPDHPDSEPKVIGDLLSAVKAAIEAGEATYLGHSEYFKDCGWEFYKWQERYFCFLNEVSSYCWEVSQNCAVNYVND